MAASDQERFTVTWTNPAIGSKREFVYETRQAAEDRVEKYERKYGQFPGYERAVIAPTADDHA